MNRLQKAFKIGDILDSLYPHTPIPLNHNDAYTLLVAVMLSAQTTDKKVNEVTPALFEKADRPSKMAEMLIESGGVKPDWDFLESLPGVGHKTASVVMAQHYNIPAFPVDTHIHLSLIHI